MLSFKPITEAAGALQAAVNVVAQTGDDANDTAKANSCYYSSLGIQGKRPSRVVASSSSESTLAV